jgi:IclR family KDG regulon transcriptional repressor
VSREASAVRTVNRICDVLNCFSYDEPVLTLTAISNHLGLPKSTIHRLLTALERQGFLTHRANGRGYQLGYQLLRWGMLAQATLDLRNEALPILCTLSAATGETAILSVRGGNEGICVEMVESNQPVRLAMYIGQRRMLHAGASAKVLWAFLPDAEVRRILNEIELVALKPNTITDHGKMYQELITIRERGYATSFEETDSGAMGVAAPVYECTGQVVAGIGIAAPIARIPPDKVPRVAPLVIDAARQLSARLGADVGPGTPLCHTDSLGVNY